MRLDHSASGIMPKPSNHWRLVIGMWIALCVFGDARGASGQGEAAELAIVGISGPARVVLTQRHPSITKPVAVILENRSPKPEVIPDEASLRNLIELEVKPLSAIPTPLLLLAPPKNFPITIAPQHKLSIVFRVKFDLGDSSPGSIGVRYHATIPQRRLDLTIPAGSENENSPSGQTPPIAGANAIGASRASQSARVDPTSPFASFGPHLGATVTAKPLRVALMKGKTSEPISFSAKWPGKSFDFSGWESDPSDPVANDLLSKSHSPSATARWKNPGTYTVTAYMYHFPPGGGGFIEAHPSEEIHVIQVEFKDENGDDADGMSIGVSTATDRSRNLTAVVKPASQTDKVTLKVTQGGSNLQIKNISPGNGTITFKAEGIGKTGSKAKKDCTIEAQVEGKEAGKAEVTVVVPSKQIQTKGAPYVKNVQANNGTSPTQPGVPGPLLATVETFHGFPVTVKILDQFDDPIVDPNNPHLYLNAPVFEAFVNKSILYPPAPINLKIRSTSDYIDPVGYQVYRDSFFGASPPWSIFNPNFSSGSTPLYGIPNNLPVHSPGTTTLLINVDGFTINPKVSRTLDIVGTTVTLTINQ